jgi:nucleoside-diphosphate-sugar epimerase
MKVFVAGATGVIGGRAVGELIAAGHEVTAIARTEEKGARLKDVGAIPIVVDLWDRDGLLSAVAGHEVVCNLATHIPPMSRAGFPGAWSENDRIRTEGARNLVDAALAAGAHRYVQESIGFLYADGGRGWLDEDAPVEPTTTTRSALAAEAEAVRVSDAGGVGVVLRFGQFCSADSSHCQFFLKMVRRRVAPVLGRRDNYLSSIHVDDAARAVVAALGLPVGVTNVVDDEPLTRQAYAEAVAAAAGVPSVHFIGAAAARLSGKKAEALARSQRISNRRLRAAGWAPMYPSAREGWAAVAAELQEG